jgi:uncharacterized protein
MTNSALYVGTVLHQRVKPRAHQLKYRAFWMLVDLDELAALSGRLRLFGSERCALFSFRQGDHGPPGDGPLRAKIEHVLRQAGIATDNGAIRLLCMPRIYGYVFNPLSVYFCYSRDGGLAAILYEVNNTFGERHSYLIPVTDRSARTIEQRCAKELYVSPFMPMEIVYDFRVQPPGDSVVVGVHGSDADGLMIAASLAGRRKELTDFNLLKLLFTIPVLTMKVTAGIHWEAFKMWVKRFRLVPRPKAPDQAVTIVTSGGDEQ